jgi:hypothetical protein
VIYLYVIFLLTVALAAGLGLLEQRGHAARLRKLELRVIVVGDEKGEIVRRCTEALRAQGRPVAAQAGMGEAILLPDGEGFAAPANAAPIPTRKRLVRAASESGATALVVEAWSSSAPLLREDREQLLAATVAIVQPENGAVPSAGVLAAAVPDGGVCLTTDARIADRLESVCRDRGVRAVLVDAAESSHAEALASALLGESIA